MPCPTCDHTLCRLGCQYSECAGTFACPRCGTLVIGHEDGHKDVIAPALVARCRDFEQALKNPVTGAVGANLRLLWHTEGIDESINTPENRQ